MHTSYFHEYLRDEYQKFIYYGQLESAISFDSLIKHITPSDEEPFAFFKWYYSEGFKVYEKYFRSLSEIIQSFDDYEKQRLTYEFNAVSYTHLRAHETDS